MPNSLHLLAPSTFLGEIVVLLPSVLQGTLVKASLNVT